MISRARLGIVAAVVVVAAFVGGYCAKPTNDSSVAAELAESLRVAAERRADAAEQKLDSARRETDRTTAKVAAADRDRIAAVKTAVQLRNTVKILNDSLVEVLDSLGVPTPVSIPEPVVTRLRADSIALAASARVIEQHEASAQAWLRERSEASQTILALRESFTALERESKLKIDAAYTRGVRAGRMQVIVVELTAGGAFLGAKLFF